LAPSSFGLRPESKEYIYEEIFQLTENCNVGYESAWNMPVEIRKWWIGRKNKDDASKTQQHQQKNPSENMIPIPEVLRNKRTK
jgi:hypothetical protein